MATFNPLQERTLEEQNGEKFSFCLTPRNINWTEIKADLNDFARRMRLLGNFHDFHPQPSKNPSHVKIPWTPPSNRCPALDAFLHAVEQDIFHTPLKSVRDNLSKHERIALK